MCRGEVEVEDADVPLLYCFHISESVGWKGWIIVVLNKIWRR